MTDSQTLGFIGTGVMGEPMCRNLAQKSGRRVLAWDLSPAPLERLRAAGVAPADSPASLAAQASILFLCLPGGAQLKSLCEESLLAAARPGLTVVDLGTSGVGLTRELAQRFAARGAAYADAPIARTREAAQKGTLSVTVGASPGTFARLLPLLRCVGSDITHCGAVGNGQVVKILNNMVLFQTVHALAEALALGRRAGMDPALLFEALSKGSADSFALRNHGMKALLPGAYPERAFSVDYAAKDNGYALELGRETGVRLRGAQLLAETLAEARAAGLGPAYWPAIAPDSTRSFSPLKNPTGYVYPWPTVVPLTDAETGIEPIDGKIQPWDGVRGPQLVEVAGKRLVEYADIDRVDYAAMPETMTIAHLAKVDLAETKARVLAMASVYWTLGIRDASYRARFPKAAASSTFFVTRPGPGAGSLDLADGA